MKMIKFLTPVVLFLLTSTFAFGQVDICGTTVSGPDVTDQIVSDNSTNTGTGFLNTGLTPGITTSFYEFNVTAADAGAYEVQVTAGLLVEDWAFTIVGGTSGICDIDFAAAGAYSYTDNGDFTTPDAICYEPGSYTIAIATSNGEQGEITIDFVALGSGPLDLTSTITELQTPPDADDTDGNICEGQQANIMINVSGGVPGYMYMWEDLPGTLIPTDVSLVTSNNTDVDPGLYQVTVTDDAGCTEVIQVDVQQMTNPTASDTELTLCEDAEGSGVADFDFAWAEDAAAMENTGGVDVTDGQGGVTTSYHSSMAGAEGETGTYANGDGLADGDPVWVRVEDGNGCYAVAEVTIIVNPIPVTADQIYTVCEANFNSSAWGTGNFTLSTMDALVDVAGGNDVSYWELLPDAEAGIGTPLSLFLYNNTSNPQIIYARVEDPVTGCWNTAEVELIVLIIPDIDPVTTPQEYCNGETIPDMVFTSTVNDPVVTTGYAWTSTVDVGFGLSGTGQIVGQTAVNTGAVVISTTLTIQPYNFGPDGVDDFGMGDDCFDTSQAFDVIIDVLPSPANDNCMDAIAVGTGMTNTCATLEAGENVGSCAPTEDASVWFTYTVLADAQDLTIDLTLTTLASPVITAYQDATDATATDCTSPELDCIAGTQLVITCVKAGDVILIAVNSALADAGDFDIAVTEGAAPVYGDVCSNAADAEDVDPDGVDGQYVLECGEVYTLDPDPLACPDDEGTCVPGNFWVYFHVDQDIHEFNISGGSFELFTGIRYDGTAQDCSANTSLGCGGGDIVVDHTLGYFILIETGTVTVTPLPPTATNDVCGSPDVFTQGVDGTLSGNNVCATGDALACSGGTDDDGHVVYYEFTTDMTSPQDVTISLAAGATTPMSQGGISVWEDCLGDVTNIATWDQVNGTGTACGVNALPGDVVLTCVPPNTTLFIAVSSDGRAFDNAGTGPPLPGDFDLTIDVESPVVANDLCADATTIAMNGTLAGENNNCASYDIDAGSCGSSPGVAESSVWYEYVLGNDVVDITVSLTPSGTDLIVAPSLVVFEDCTGTLYDPNGPSEDCAGAEVIIDCPVQGTLLIQVSSEFINTGEFDITVTEGAPQIIHDVCTDPMTTTLVDCEPTTVMIDNTNACPEEADFGAGVNCGYDVNPTVWVEVIVPANGVGFDVDMISAGTMLSVFDNNCPPTTIFDNVCISADEEVLVAPGTYLVAVSSLPADEGVQSFDITTIVPPPNDLCADAETLSTGVATAGSTICATLDVGGLCTPVDEENTVFYEWVADADYSRVTIDVTSFTPQDGAGVDAIGLAIFEDCGFTTILDIDQLSAIYCGASGTELLTLGCVETGDAFTIVVTSSSANEGTFDITVNELAADPGCDDNDQCDSNDADPFSAAVITDDPAGPVCATICNTFACPDDEIDALCNAGGTIFNTVFYTFTTDGDPALTDGTQVFLNVDLPGGTIGNSSIMVIEGGCGGYSFLQQANGGGDYGCFGGPQGPVEVTGELQPNTTYTVVIGTTDNVGGTDDLCLEITTGCVNDECATAITLDENTLISTQTNACTMDATAFNCGALEQASAWYVFNLPAGFSGANITISNVAPGNAYSVQVFDGAAGCVGPDVTDGTNCASPGLLEILCLTPDQDYYILVGTEDSGGEVNFDIEVDFLTPTEAGSPANDICDGAEVVSGPDCEIFTVTAVNTKACPDAGLDATGCNFSADATVWFEITIPPNGYGLIIENVSADTEVALLDACPATSFFNTNGGAGCVTAGPPDTWPVTENTTYYIAVANINQGSHTFDLTILVSPPGDEISDPFDLNASSYSENTCCANGGNPGPFENPNGEDTNLECNTTFDDHTVWMVYTPPAGVDAVEFIYSGVNASMEIASGPPGGPWTHINGAAMCGSTGESIILPYCDDTEEFLIKISTTDDDCGEVTLTAKEYVPCAYADVCEETTGEFTPVTDEDGFNAANYECINGCLDVACPDTDGSCGYDQIPTVWFQVDIDDIAAQMYVNVVSTDGSWDPVFSIFEGTCPGGLTEVGTAATPACNTGWNDPVQINQPVDPSVQTEYWIAVGAENFDVGDDPTFEICVLTTINLIICLGDGSCTPATNFEVTVRSNDPDGDLGLPLDGPFCQGETVTICADFFYDASDTGVDWLIGLTPFFGPGWDLSAFDPSTAVVTGNGQAGMWFDAGIPILQEPVGTICTYTDDFGFLQICNGLCTNCTECTPGMQPGDELPGGWFWVTNGGNAGCDNDGTPGEGWGIGSVTANVMFCVDLPVKEFADEAECELNKNLNFGFQTFSDGVGGCWEDPVGECLLDEAQTFVNEAECEVPPPTEGEDEICNKATTDLVISAADGSTVEIVVTAITNPNITGATDWNFPAGAGFGTVADQLCNTTGVEQIQIYEAMTVIPGLDCPGPITEHEVIVYPELEVEFVFPFDPMPICYDDDEDFAPTVIGGTGNNYTYEWTDGSTDDDINIENPGDYAVGVHTMCVTVTDDLGCMGEDCFDFEILPEIFIEIVGPNQLCLDCDNGPVNGTDVTLTFQDNSSTPIVPGQLTWIIDDLTGGDLVTITPPGGTQLFIYDCIETPLTPIPGGVMSDVGEFEIILSGFDQYGCQFETEPFLFETVSGPPIDITQLSCDATGSEYNFVSEPVQETKIDICDADDPTTILFTLFGEGDVTLAPGNYIVKSNFTGTTCGTVEDLVVTVGPPAVIDAPAVCVGTDGVATIVNCGDYSTIEWTATDTGCTYTIPNADLTMDSTFVITLTDPNGCEGFANVTIPVNPNPDPMMTGLVEFCTGSSSTLGLDDTYMTYAWSTTEATPTITVTTGGTYSVIVTDVNGCTGETSLTVTVGDLIVQDGSQEICEDDTATFSVGDTPGFTYQWSDSAGPIGGETTFEFTTGTAGVYTCEVTDPNVVGCSGTGTFTLTTTALPVIDLTTPDTACNDSQGGNTLIDLTAYEGGSDAGTWTDDAAIFGGTFDPANLDFDQFALGDYTFTFTTTPNGQCDPISQSLVITVVECSCPVAVGPIPDICTNQPESIDLDARESPVDAGEWTFVGAMSDMLIVNANATGSLLDIPVTTAAGVYTLQYTLPGFNPECAETVSFEVFEQPFAVLEEDQTRCNDASSGGETCLDFTILVTGGDTGGTWVEDPQYVIDFGAVTDWTNVCFDQLAEGASYEFTYTTNSAAGPCQDVEYVLEVDVEDCQCKIPDTTPMPTVCAETGSYQLSTFVDLAADPGNWSLTTLGSGDNSTITLSTTEITVSATTTPGTYVFQYDNINPTGGTCVEFSQQTLTVVAPPTAAMTQPDVQACSEIPLQTGSVDNITDIESFLDPSSDAGVWSDNGPNGGLLAGGQTIDNINTAGIPVGTIITFTYTTTTGGGNPCDDVTASIDLIVIDCDCPPIDTDAPMNFCNTGGTLDLTTLEGNSADGTWTVTGASGGGDMTLAVITGDMLTIDMNTPPGTYELTFTLDNPVPNCDLTFTIETFEVFTPPVVTFDPATACNQVNTSGTATDNILDLTDYFAAGSDMTGTSWTSAAEADGLDLSDPSNVDFSGLMGSSPITITFTTNNATDPCLNTTGDLIVTVIDCTLPPCPDLTVTDPDDVCNDGATVDLSLSETATTVAGSWSEMGSNGTLGILSGDIVTIDAATTPGTYTFIFTPDVTPVDPCPLTSMVEFDVEQAVDAGQDGFAEFCDSETGVVDLFLQLTGADTGGTWIETSSILTNNNAFDSGNGTVIIDDQVAGTYTFRYTLTATDPCTDDDSEVVIVINADPVADAGPAMQLNCALDPLTLDGSASSAGTDLIYEWSLDATVVQSGTDTDYITSQDGTYTLTVINTVTGCRATAFVDVTTDPTAPTLDAVPCTDMGEGIIFLSNMTGVNLPFTLEIEDSQGNIQLIENAQDLTEVSGLDPDLYDVTLIDAVGCRSSAESLIIVSAESIINNETDADTVEFGTLYTLEVNDFLVNSDGIELIEWFDEDGNLICQQPSDDCSSIERLVERAELICLRVTDERGCVNEDCIWLRFQINNQVFTPNIFDPNGEENPWVYPQTDKTAMIPKFSVFDRWGNLIFVRENFDSNIPELGWDGNYNGALAEQGVYVYLYDAVFPDGEIKSVAKDITLIR